MSRYNTIIKNDVTNGEGVCVSLFTQGCPHHCTGCFNKETWDFEKGKLYTEKTRKKILHAISANGIQRNFSILGGEPLAHQNLPMTEDIVASVRMKYPNVKIYIWTGYIFEELDRKNLYIYSILNKINYLIDGPFIEEEKNLNLELRGSNNQRIWIREERLWRIKNDKIIK